MRSSAAILGGTLSRYFGMRFLIAVLAVFAGVIVMVAILDYMEMVRRTAPIRNVSGLLVLQTSLFRVPQVTERILPFAVLIGAMSSYLALSRRLELVVARAAGLSAWEFVAPAVIVAFGLGLFGTMVYNPISAALQEHSKRLEAGIFGKESLTVVSLEGNLWVRQRSDTGQSIINALNSEQQGLRLSGVTAFTFDLSGKFLERIEANTAALESGFWRLTDARIYAAGTPPREEQTYKLPTNLTPAQVRESFATPETVPFWQLPSYIEIAKRAGVNSASYQLQYHKLLSRPFLLVAMVLLAAAFSLRFFRFGGVQKMVLGGIGSGFLLYVLTKVTDDMSRAELMHPIAAAWLPVLVGGLTGLVALLYQEDG
jgi:lipopolysaccharide export system permease protein